MGKLMLGLDTIPRSHISHRCQNGDEDGKGIGNDQAAFDEMPGIHEASLGGEDAGLYWSMTP